MQFLQQSPIKLPKYICNAYLLSANTTTTKKFTNMTYTVSSIDKVTEHLLNCQLNSENVFNMYVCTYLPIAVEPMSGHEYRNHGIRNSTASHSSLQRIQ